MKHCMKAFSRGLKVNTAIEELVWAHSEGPAEARKVATEYFAHNYRRIQVGTIYNCVSMFPAICACVPCKTKEQILDRQGLGMRARVFSFLTPAFFSFQSFIILFMLRHVGSERHARRGSC